MQDYRDRDAQRSRASKDPELKHHTKTVREYLDAKARPGSSRHGGCLPQEQ